MRYRITIERIDGPVSATEGSPLSGGITTQVYQQTFDELNVTEMITRLNHKPRKRSAKKAAKT
jgi:hypothetical protein